MDAWVHLRTYAFVFYRSYIMKVNRKVVDVLIEKFASENRVDELKVASLVYNALSNVTAPKPVAEKSRKSTVTRLPNSDDIIKVKHFIETKKTNEEFTVRDVSNEIGMSISNVNSNLRTLKKDGVVKELGRVKTGKPGHPAILWKHVA